MRTISSNSSTLSKIYFISTTTATKNRWKLPPVKISPPKSAPNVILMLMLIREKVEKIAY